MTSSYFAKWGLTDPTLLTTTDTSRIYKVKFRNQLAILKELTEIGRKAEGGAPTTLNYFNGVGSVKLLAFDEGAQLLEYIDGPTLEYIVTTGRDHEAAEVIADVVTKLHSSREQVPKNIRALSDSFQTLHKKAGEPGIDPLFIKASELAKKLISTTTHSVVLHGDLHHQNILKSDARGWVAIDPQALLGDPAYDLANTFYNPHESAQLTEDPERIRMYSQVFSQRLNIDQKRILEFAFVGGALSACWSLEDGKSPHRRLRIAEIIYSLINHFPS